MPSLFAATQFFKELTAVEAGHFVVAQNGVGRLVDDLEQSVGTVIGKNDFAMRLQALFDQVADQWIIFHDQKVNRFGGSGSHLTRALVMRAPFRCFSVRERW